MWRGGLRTKPRQSLLDAGLLDQWQTVADEPLRLGTASVNLVHQWDTSAYDPGDPLPPGVLA
jgi:hypothetical protein